MPHQLSRRDILKVAGGVTVAASTGLLAACASGPRQRETPAGEVGPPRKGGTLTVGQVGFGSAENMNLSFAGSGVDILRQCLIREGLWQYRGDTFGVQNTLAESHRLSADGRTLTLRLRAGVVWHNGRQFTANDVIWTIQQWRDSPSTKVISGLVDYTRLTKIDELTVQVGLNMAVADFPGIAAASWNTYVIQDGTSYDDPNCVGTGPFMLASFQPGTAKFTANRNYWDEGPYLDGIVSDSSFRSDQARLYALRAGKIDVMPLLPFALARAAGNAKVMTSACPGFLAVAFRIDQPPFNDPRVIEAMKLLINRETVVNSVYAGHAEIGNDLPMKGAPYYASDLKRPYDPDKATSLLKAAGAEDIQASIVSSNFYPGASELATVYAQAATEIGLDVTVDQIDTSQFWSPNGANGYLSRTAGINSWNPSTLSAVYLLGFNSAAPYSDTHWGSPSDDALLFDAIAEQDTSKAEQKWHAVQEAQFHRGGYIIPAHQNYVDAVGPHVQGLSVTPSGFDFNNCKFNTAWIDQ